MGHADRWRSAALIGAAAGLVTVPAVGGALFVVAMARSTRRRQAPLAWRPAWATAAVLVLVGLAGTVSVPGLLLTVGLAAIAPLLALWSAVARPEDADAIALGLTIGIGANLVAALTSAQGVPIAGFTFHPNVLGALAAMVVPSAVALTRFRPQGVRWRWPLPLAVLAVVAATGSRGAMAAALGGVGWLALQALRGDASRPMSPAGRGRLALAAFVALAALLALWVGVRQPTSGEAVGLTGRSALWGVALELIVDRPVLGHGPKAWERLVETVEPAIRPVRFPHAHSGYLELALDYGLVGLAVVVAFLVTVVAALARHRPGLWSVAAQATWLAFAIVNVGDTFVIDARFLALAGLVTGAAWARGAAAVRAPSVSPPAPTPPRPTS